MINILFGNFCDWRTYITKNLNYPTYRVFTGLKNIIDNKNINLNLIIPCSIEEILYCNSNYSSLNNIICCRDSTLVDMLDNKLKFILWMNQNNFSTNIPELYYSKVDNIETKYSEFTFPCISKNIVATAAVGSYFINSPKDINYNNNNFTIQKYIDSPDEYTCHFYVKNKLILYSKVFKTSNLNKLYMIKGSITNYVVLNLEDKYLDIFKNIFEKLNYNGFACANCRIKDDILYIFEINPRLGGSIVKNNYFFRELIDLVVVVN